MIEKTDFIDEKMRAASQYAKGYNLHKSAVMEFKHGIYI